MHSKGLLFLGLKVARINIEEKIFSDARFLFVQDKIGRFNAMGQFVYIVKTAQEFWTRGKQKIPKKVIEVLGIDPVFFDAGLLEEHDDGTYLKGSEDGFAWIIAKKESGRIGGIKSSQSRQNSNLPEATASETQANPSTPQAVVNQIEPSCSYSSSSSCSSSEEKRESVHSHKHEHDVEKIIEKFIELGGISKPNSKAHKKRVNLINERLEEGYSLEDCLNAVIGQHKSTIGKKERIYYTLDTIFRSLNIDMCISKNAKTKEEIEAEELEEEQRRFKEIEEEEFKLNSDENGNFDYKKFFERVLG